MVETWRDSWFEEGTRVLYLLPQSIVDGVLPLDIDPKPADTTRVFVGRMELVTPEIESEVAQAIRVNDRATLQKYGRFLEPISQLIEGRLKATHDEVKIGESLGGLVGKQASTACRAPANSRTTNSTAPSIQ